jgi:hypothetical protein
MGNGFKWNVGELNDAHAQTTKPLVTSLATNNVLRVSCKSFKPQNGPTPNEHVKQGLDIVLSEVLLAFICLSTTTKGNCLPIQIAWPHTKPGHILWVSNLFGTSFAYKYVIIDTS